MKNVKAKIIFATFFPKKRLYLIECGLLCIILCQNLQICVGVQWNLWWLWLRAAQTVGQEIFKAHQKSS